MNLAAAPKFLEIDAALSKQPYLLVLVQVSGSEPRVEKVPLP